MGDWLAAVKNAAVTAGQATTPKYDDVAIGAPVPRGRCVRVWWAGEAIPAPQMGEVRYSLDHEIVGHEIAVTVFEPMGDASEQASEDRMATIADFVVELRDAIDIDRSLGGKSMSVEPEATPADFVNIGGTLYAIASMVMPVGVIEFEVGNGS